MPLPLPDLILASASPRRAKLLEQHGYAFTILPADIEELCDGRIDPITLCTENARRKAVHIARHHAGSLVLGCDTIVCVDADILGKPADRTQARATLERLQGRSHTVISGVALICLQRDIDVQFHVSTKVTFLPLRPEHINHYLDSITFEDKAGAYAAQDHGDMIIESIQGSFSNVVGLPMEQLRIELDRLR